MVPVHFSPGLRLGSPERVAGGPFGAVNGMDHGGQVGFGMIHNVRVDANEYPLDFRSGPVKWVAEGFSDDVDPTVPTEAASAGFPQEKRVPQGPFDIPQRLIIRAFPAVCAEGLVQALSEVELLCRPVGLLMVFFVHGLSFRGLVCVNRSIIFRGPLGTTPKLFGAIFGFAGVRLTPC